MLSNYASKSFQQHYLVTAAKFYIFDLRKPTITSESTQTSKTLPITILHSAPSSKIVPRPPELSATFGGRVITILKPSDPKVREYLSNTNLTTCRPPANVVSVPLTFTDKVRDPKTTSKVPVSKLLPPVSLQPSSKGYQLKPPTLQARDIGRSITKSSSDIDIKEEIISQESLDDPDILLCGLCGQQFTMLSALELHQETKHHQISIKEEEIFFESDSIVDEEQDIAATAENIQSDNPNPTAVETVVTGQDVQEESDQNVITIEDDDDDDDVADNGGVGFENATVVPETVPNTTSDQVGDDSGKNSADQKSLSLDCQAASSSSSVSESEILAKTSYREMVSPTDIDGKLEFPCKLCQKIFTSMGALCNHLNFIHFKDQGPRQ